MAKYAVNNLPLLTQEKIVATWSLARFERDRHTREEILTRARALVGNEAAYRAGNKRGARKYITSQNVDPETGELLPGRDTLLDLDQDKIEADAQLDGYYLLRTSETQALDVDIIARYHQLVQIEDAFRVTKTDLSARPVYVRTPAHIEAHFAVCFLALLITRLLTRWAGLPSGQVLDAIRGMVALPVGDGIYRLARPGGWDRIDQATGVGLNHDWVSLAQLRSWQRDLIRTMKTVPFTTRKTIQNPVKPQINTQKHSPRGQNSGSSITGSRKGKRQSTTPTTPTFFARETIPHQTPGTSTLLKTSFHSFLS